MTVYETLTLVAERMAEPCMWIPGARLGRESAGCLLDHVCDVLGLERVRGGYMPYSELSGTDAVRLLAATILFTPQEPWSVGSVVINTRYDTFASECCFAFNDLNEHADVLDLVHRAARFAKELGL